MKIKTKIKLLDIISNITLVISLLTGFVSDWRIGVTLLCLYITVGIDIVIAPYKAKDADHGAE